MLEASQGCNLQPLFELALLIKVFPRRLFIIKQCSRYDRMISYFLRLEGIEF